jgi:hypothetical protein
MTSEALLQGPARMLLQYCTNARNEFFGGIELYTYPSTYLGSQTIVRTTPMDSDPTIEAGRIRRDQGPFSREDYPVMRPAELLIT